MHLTATTTLSLCAILSCIPTITAIPTSTPKRDSSTFNDGLGDIPNDQFSMVVASHEVSGSGYSYTFNINTAAGRTVAPNFEGTSNNWQVVSSNLLPNGWNVDVLFTADTTQYMYAGQYFIVGRNETCGTLHNSSFETDGTFYRCLCPLKPS